mmetsp:Transcript_113846/g.157643  ORF Transcript_113846/g.157643 Transcript_113846/m.157643 type:complete len:210 (+) Transcript_113846:618-1247(+)
MSPKLSSRMVNAMAKASASSTTETSMMVVSSTTSTTAGVSLLTALVDTMMVTGEMVSLPEKVPSCSSLAIPTKVTSSKESLMDRVSATTRMVTDMLVLGKVTLLPVMVFSTTATVMFTLVTGTLTRRLMATLSLKMVVSIGLNIRMTRSLVLTRESTPMALFLRVPSLMEKSTVPVPTLSQAVLFGKETLLMTSSRVMVLKLRVVDAIE